MEGSDSDDGKEVKGLESKQYASISNIMPSLCRFQLVSLALPIRKIIESSLIEPPHDHHSVYNQNQDELITSLNETDQLSASSVSLT